MMPVFLIVVRGENTRHTGKHVTTAPSLERHKMKNSVLCEICNIQIDDIENHVKTSEHLRRFFELLAQEEDNQTLKTHDVHHKEC